MGRIANASFIRNFKSLLYPLLFVCVLRYIYMYISVEIRGQPGAALRSHHRFDIGFLISFENIKGGLADQQALGFLPLQCRGYKSVPLCMALLWRLWE